MHHFGVTLSRLLLSCALMVAVMVGSVAILSMEGCKTTAVKTTPGKPRDENLIKIALACKDVTDGVTFGIKVKRALYADGGPNSKISKAVSSTITTYLTKVQNATNELAAKSLLFDTFTAGQADLFKLFRVLLDARKDLEVNGTIPGFSGVMAEIFQAIDIGLNAITPLFPTSLSAPQQLRVDVWFKPQWQLV